jgi:Leucine-rich repeat (LRR) protein
MSKEIKNFNSKFKTDITENIEELDLLSKKIGDQGLKILCSIKFTKITQLLLEENDISNIDVLAKNNFGKNLIALDLSTNKISSIEVLAKLNFPSLNHLFLNSNQISSIDIFAKVNFPNLKELNLSSNKLTSIDIFSKVNFTKLTSLDLSKNQISSIDILASAKFPNLEDLSLDQNNISSIDILAKIKCDNFKKLKLEKNNLKSINVLEKISFNKLNYLSIGDDTLGDKVDCLTKIKFGELEDIYLYLNDSIDRETQQIQEIATYFEDKGVTFNFISCDDDNDNDVNFDNDELNIGGGKNNNLDGFDVLLNNDAF